MGLYPPLWRIPPRCRTVQQIFVMTRLSWRYVEYWLLRNYPPPSSFDIFNNVLLNLLPSPGQKVVACSPQSVVKFYRLSWR
jgi:hypothetical protein